MKFIKLESRGGNYLVVAENVAWLRTAENGQTTVGIVGGQPLLVVGSIEEVADKILTASAGQEQPEAVPQPAPPPPQAAAQPAPDEAPPPEPVEAAQKPAAEPAPLAAANKPAAERPQIAIRPGTTLSERLAAAATTPKVKPGTQRHMGALE
ncbi:hypothetical protein OIK40_01270 [Erythrobacter sp. sf7]|uniref:Uncharacterized protein n=1 Tax=Erythrobacter fulvus TaxID=2987523 RepID=A0ABT5JNU1_9SPHN|nr:hypothetical protein [Erythrobacter fulvus]MDC8753267.1 hypothetical protein [Erythrobacter fulvus]